MSRCRLLFKGVKVALTNIKALAAKDSSSTPPCETDWSECFICKEDKDERLMYPNVKKEGAGFTTIVENLIRHSLSLPYNYFEEIERLYFSLERLDEQGNSIKETLKWNKKLACSKTMLSRLKRESVLTK